MEHNRKQKGSKCAHTVLENPSWFGQWSSNKAMNETKLDFGACVCVRSVSCGQNRRTGSQAALGVTLTRHHIEAVLPLLPPLLR